MLTRTGSLLLALSLAACGAPGLDTFSQDVAGTAVRAHAASPDRGGAKLQVRLSIPRRHAGKSDPDYVSASTASIVILEDGHGIGTFDTTPSSKGCAAASGSTLCRFVVGVTPGHRTYTVTAYDEKDGKGNVLSSGQAVEEIVTGLNVVTLTMHGVVTSIQIATTATAGLSVGTPGTLDVVVMALDADGNVIVGPGAYGVPISVSDGDASGHTMLSVDGGVPSSAIVVHAPSNRVTLSYDGSELTSLTLTPSASGVSSVGTLTLLPAPAFSSLTVPASGSLSGEFAQDITTGSDGDLWFSFSGATFGNGIGAVSTTGQFRFYFPGTAPSTNLPNSFIGTIVGAAAGAPVAAWFDAGTKVGSIATGGTVTMYSAPSLCGGGGGPTLERMAADGSGGNWVAVSCFSGGDQLLHVDASGNMTLTAQNASFEKSLGIAVGRDGNVYVTGADVATGNAAMLQAKVSGGAVTSSSVLVSTAKGAWSYIAQSADGDLWTGNAYCQSRSSITRVHLAPSFTASTATNFPLLQGCAEPSGIVPLPDDSLWVASTNYSQLFQVVPGANEGQPTINTVPIPNNKYNTAVLQAGTLGSDGALYFGVNTGYAGFPGISTGEILKVRY